MKVFAFLFVALILAGCGHDSGSSAEPLTPMPPAPISPGDEVLIHDLAEYFKTAKAPVQSLYDVYRTDLNHDGRRDALVLMRTPYGYWCDRYGCKMLILRAHDDRFELVGAVEPVRGPVHVANNTSHGWRDLVVWVSGWWTKQTKAVALEFDGTTYPSDPTDLPPISYEPQGGEERIFAGYDGR